MEGVDSRSSPHSAPLPLSSPLPFRPMRRGWSDGGGAVVGRRSRRGQPRFAAPRPRAPRVTFRPESLLLVRWPDIRPDSWLRPADSHYLRYPPGRASFPLVQSALWPVVACLHVLSRCRIQSHCCQRPEHHFCALCSVVPSRPASREVWVFVLSRVTQTHPDTL